MGNVYFYKYRLCTLGITEESGAITRIFFAQETSLPGFELAESPLIGKAGAQLDEYFSGKTKTFDLPLNPKGTDFQLSVWKALGTIPYCQTCSYKHIAGQINNPKACRAVGLANNKNPIVIVIPCHRVIGSNNTLTGYGGGLELKQQLLQLENMFNR